MKQTNNAIKFLMAQYRAIFKNAYFKGMATALVLTAGLAAGAAQAVPANDYWYSYDSSSGFVSHNFNEALPSGSVAIGEGEHSQLNFTSDGKLDGSVTDGHLSIGKSGDIVHVSGSGGLGDANGGYIFHDNNSSITNFLVSDSDVTLLDGGIVDENVRGAYIDVHKGNVTATNNISTIKGGSVGKNVYGASISTEKGSATASGNQAIVKADVADTISIGNSSDKWNAIRGVVAEATDTISLTGNSVSIEIYDSNKTDTQFTFDKANTLEGALGVIASGGTGAQAVISSNSVTANNIKIGDTSGAFVFGGRGQVDAANTNVVEITARDNTVSLTNSHVINNATAVANGVLQIVGNTAWAMQDSVSTGKNNVRAIGDGTTANVYIEGGNLQFIGASDLTDNASGLEQNSMVAGGFAITSASGGSATASANVVSINNTTATNVNFYGGIAYSVKADGSDQVTASQNVLTIDATDVTVNNATASRYTHNNIAGGVAFADPEGNTNSNKLTEKNTVTASQNVVTITNSAYKDTEANTAKNINADVYGALISTGAKATNEGKAVTVANQNAVKIDKGLNVTGSVYGVLAGFNGSFTGNTVDVNAKVSAQPATVGGAVTPETVAGVFITAGDSGGTATEHAKLTATNNTVNIGADAEITNANIVAVDLGYNNYQNTDVIHSGNKVIVNGTYIVNDTGATPYSLAGDDVQITSTALIHVKDGTLNISGIADGNTTPNYYNGTGTVAAGAKIANADTINVYNSLDVQGDDSLFAVSNAALLSVDGGSAKEEANELDPVTEEGATLKITQAGLTNYLTANANDVLDYDLDKDGTLDADDRAGAVQVTKTGTIDFKDSVQLSDFNFTTDTPLAGQIKVDTSINTTEPNLSGSFFKADTVTVAHKLATNTTTAQGKYGNLTALDNTSGVAIVANTLNLGAADLSSTRSAAITFGQATVKEEINFIARTSGKDIADDAAGTELGTFNDGYHLTSKVIGSNYMLTNNQDAAKEYYTSLAGNINGAVTVEGSGGEIHIKDGDWTANDLVTVASSGTVTVGNGTEAESLKDSSSLPDATLSLAAGLVLDVTASGTATVTANGDQERAYQEPDADDFYGDNRYVELDLTNGVDMKVDSDGTISGSAVINATSGGVILLNASDVNDILAQNHAWNDKTGGTNNNHSGAFFKASAGGELRVDGDITALFRDFDGSEDTNGFYLSGSNYTYDNTNVINADYSGRLVADSLTIVNPHSGTVKDDSDYVATADKVYLGGAVLVKDLEINDLQQTNGDDKPAGTNTYASQVTIANGGAQISHSLTSFNDKLILGDEGNSSAILYFEANAVADEGTISVNKIELASGSEIDFANGKWDASATDFNLSGAGSMLIVGDDYSYDMNDDPFKATLEAGDLTMGADTTLYVAANGIASFNGANLKELTAPASATDDAGILVEGYLTINGTAISDTNKNGGVTFGEEGSIRIANNGTLNFGKAAVNGAIVADGQHTGDTVTLRDGYTKIANQGGTLRLDLADSTTFSAKAIQSLKNQLFTAGSFNSDGILADGGLLNIGKANFDGFTGYKTVDDPAKGLHGYTATWDEVKDFSDIFSEDVTNDMNSTANITGIDPGDEVKGAWGSLSMNPNVPTSAQVTLAGNTTLSYAEGNNGFFISDNDHKIALGAIVEAQKTFNLVNGGTIGKVTLTNGKDNANDDRNLTTLNINGNGNLTTINGIDTVISNNTTAYATRVNVNSDADVTGDITGVGRVNVNEGATLHVYNPDATSKDVPEVLVNTLAVRNGNAQIDGDLIIDGNYNSQNEGFGGEGKAYAVGGTITATNIDLEHDAALTTVHGGLISAETVTAVADTNGQSDSLITVGQDLDYETWDDTEEAAYTGTGYLEISKYLDLNGGTLMVDPVYGEATSVAAVMNFKEGNDKTWDSVTNDVGIIDGRALIGKNAALGIGASLEDTRAVIADFQENGSLSQEKYGSILYLNGQLTIANGSEIALNADPVTSDVDGIRRALKYTITSNQLDQFATLGLGANTAILMSEAAFEDADGKKTQTAIHFDRESAVINANGGEIVLIGAFDASEKLNFFSDKDSGNNNGVDIVNASGADGTIKVYTQNGFLFATLTGKNQGQGVQLHVDQDKAFSVMSEASYPVVETLISYHEDRIAQDTTTTPETPAPEAPEAGNENQSGSSSIPAEEILTQSELDSRTSEQEPQEPSNQNTQVANTRVTGSSDFLNEVVTKSHGAPAEAAARLAIYGGAVQAAMAATSSTTDAIAARMGVGDTAAITMANNGQGAALWLAPVYKTHDSDSFDSQGLDYGVDLNLYGVALGADFEFMPGLTAGIMFNVGSGDADGQGNAAANNTSNDFDYWGAALYGNYTYDALSVTADVSYTAVDNDLEATTGMQQYGKLESSTDTTAISLGVTAKYTFDFGGVEVAPHAGLRYTNIDLDDYSIKSNGETIADYSADKVNIFSIPVGVTFAKEFTGDAWTVKPSLDLTLTGNFGDDDISGDVSWTGVDGLVTPVSSEYMDDFTYGATLGIEAASTGGFSLGLGVNYTGSSNVDEFGVNANARFVF